MEPVHSSSCQPQLTSFCQASADHSPWSFHGIALAIRHVRDRGPEESCFDTIGNSNPAWIGIHLSQAKPHKVNSGSSGVDITKFLGRLTREISTGNTSNLSSVLTWFSTRFDSENQFTGHHDDLWISPQLSGFCSTILLDRRHLFQRIELAFIAGTHLSTTGSTSRGSTV